MARSQTYDVQFTPGGFRFLNPRDREHFRRWGASWAPKFGFLEATVGERSRSLKQNAFFHGPILGAFIRLSGTADPDYWKWALKQKFLKRFTNDGQEYAADTSALSVSAFSDFIDSCVNYLIDQGGYLDEQEAREWKETKKDE